ncbi:MAG: hypothetical protein WC548_04610 [Candidatus Pacearchaeota archaeon]
MKTLEIISKASIYIFEARMSAKSRIWCDDVSSSLCLKAMERSF